MVVSIGLGSYIIAFFHICTHAFFKAMLFLSSGSIIHSLKKEQDIRKMGGLFFFLPVTRSCVLLGRLALIGTPFLSGFYSKDLILELGLLSFCKFLGLLLAFLSSLFTVIYSFRIIIFCFLYPMLGNSLLSVSEEKANLIFPIFRLGLGTIFCGWFFCGFVFSSVVFILPIFFKSLALFLIFFGIILRFCYYLGYKSFFSSSFVYWFLSYQWYFLFFSHFFISFFYFLLSLIRRSQLDRGWYKNLGPRGRGGFISYRSSFRQRFYSGYLKYYILSSFLISGVFLTLLVLI